ncbi:YfbU family protein [Streptomyces cyaneofuscatus]|uniref:YfbU family protein n=1 Tax=Streptomyces cyaneofuscatus TaxID=66883 RepID=UPI002FEEB8B2
MELTDAERLILSNQYQILAKLDNDEHYALMAETLRRGYKWLYDEYLEQSLWPNVDDDKAEFVVDVLDLYSTLKASYSELEDKSGIEAREVKFPGFDGNNEGDLMGFANFLLKHGRFDDVLNKGGNNSHMPTVEIYRRMLQAWRDMGEPAYPYSKEQIRQLLDARKYR